MNDNINIKCKIKLKPNKYRTVATVPKANKKTCIERK
jgi:hypothetical protein